MAQQGDIESILKENRVFNPDPAFSSKAHIKSMAEYERLYRESIDEPEKFWAKMASELHWFKPWSKVLEWELPFSKWFVGAKTNMSYNCLDRHLATSRKNKVAILWEGEPGETRALSYQMLHREVSRFANVLKSLGLRKGDRATVYMGMVPELAIALLACARIGVAHNVVFGGFSAEALRDRRLTSHPPCTACRPDSLLFRRARRCREAARSRDARSAPRRTGGNRRPWFGPSGRTDRLSSDPARRRPTSVGPARSRARRGSGS